MICEICGKDSGEKPLCLPCWKATKSNEYTRCTKCGKWKKDDKPVCISCYRNASDEDRKKFKAMSKTNVNPGENRPNPTTQGASETPIIDAAIIGVKGVINASRAISKKVAAVKAAKEAEKTLCAVCGENSKGKTLCYSCYEREKAGEITKCVDCEKWKNNKLPRCRDCWEKEQKAQGDRDFRQKYPDSPMYRCKQGILVRSKAEVVIADFLYDNKIQFRYETMRMLGDIEVHPDFYLEEVDLFLEHCGMDSADYIAKRQKKEQLYAAHKQKFVTTNKEDESELHDALKRKLHKHFPDKQLK